MLPIRFASSTFAALRCSRVRCTRTHRRAKNAFSNQLFAAMHKDVITPATILRQDSDTIRQVFSGGQGVGFMAVRGRALALFVTAGLGLVGPSALAQSLVQAPLPKPLPLLPWGQIAPPPEESADDEADDAQPAQTA